VVRVAQTDFFLPLCSTRRETSSDFEFQRRIRRTIFICSAIVRVIVMCKDQTRRAERQSPVSFPDFVPNLSALHLIGQWHE
jgi:hypothetical protein